MSVKKYTAYQKSALMEKCDNKALSLMNSFFILKLNV